jgi:branched-chain amino acid transport system substrate-binding protein
MNPLASIRRGRLAVATTALALLVAACGGGSTSSGGSGTSKAPINIAYVTDLTGGNSGNSIGGKAGFDTALKEINDAGGANGHKLVTTTYDSQSDVNAFQTQLRQALGTTPNIVAGQWLSASTAAGASVIGSSNIPFMAASYTVTGVDTVPYWFSTSPLASGVGAGIANGLKGILGGSLTGKKIAFEGLISPAVDGNLAAIKQQVEAGGGSMGMITRDPVQFSSWTSQAANMAATRPDAVVTNNTDPNTATVVKSLAVAGYNGPIISTEGANSDALLKAANSSNFYVVRETVVPTSDAKLYKDAIAAGVTPDNTAQSYFGKMYAAAYAISAAEAKCGDTCSTSKFVSTLKGLGKINIPNNALAGPLDFSKANSGLTSAQVWQWDSANSKSVAKGGTFSIVA